MNQELRIALDAAWIEVLSSDLCNGYVGAGAALRKLQANREAIYTMLARHIEPLLDQNAMEEIRWETQRGG